MNLHKYCLDRLAFYANGTLVGKEHEQVHRHLNECLVCQHEYAAQQLMVNSVSDQGVIRSDPAVALSELSTRISNEAQSSSSLVHKMQRVFAHTPRPVRYVLLVQSALLLLTATLFVSNMPSSEPQARYRTLSNAGGPAGDIRIVFAPDASELSRDTLLQQTGLHIVDGPTARGVYTVKTTTATHVIETLQQSPIVLFAQPLSSPGTQQP